MFGLWRVGAIHESPLRSITLLMLLLVLAGCGKKGPVQPLRQPLPAAPEALTVQQKGDRFLVAWRPPARNLDGSALENLEKFRVYKMRYDLANDCPECRDTSVLLQEVDLDYLRDVRRVGERLYLWDTELEAGVGYQYRIVPVNTKRREGAPVILRLPFVNPPAAPGGLAAENHDLMVRLRWQPVTEAGAEAELLGYNLYRREGDEPFAFAPVNPEILTEPTFEDYGVENGRTYIYSVRTVARIRGNTVESPLSATAEARPQAGL
jgi:predicted small lipoprotein YifL